MNILIWGATSDIAKEVARLYSTAENNFLLVARDNEKLLNIQADLLARGSKSVHIELCDLSMNEKIVELKNKILTKLIIIDLMIIAHGTLPVQSEIENNANEVVKQVNTNFTSYLTILTEFASVFEKQTKGSVVVFSSVAGDRGRRSNYIYGSLKSGLQAFVEGYSARLSRVGVHVLDVRPGMVDTSMTKHLKKGALFSTPKKVAVTVKNAITGQKKVLYTPFFWKYIMLVIRSIPRAIFYKLNF